MLSKARCAPQAPTNFVRLTAMLALHWGYYASPGTGEYALGLHWHNAQRSEGSHVFCHWSCTARQGRPFGEALPMGCLQNIYISSRSDHFISIPTTSLHQTSQSAEGTQLKVGEALYLLALVGAVPDSQNRRIETSRYFKSLMLY